MMTRVWSKADGRPGAAGAAIFAGTSPFPVLSTRVPGGPLFAITATGVIARRIIDKSARRSACVIPIRRDVGRGRGGGVGGLGPARAWVEFGHGFGGLLRVGAE